MMLDLDKIGPDWKLAREHGLACTPGRPIYTQQNQASTTSLDISPILPRKQSNNLCECCLNIVNKEPISLC